ncbi:MAG TPA: hypothetical protein VGN07_17025 [Steroidobacteraceae bacterium]|jgi:hypothetical protein
MFHKSLPILAALAGLTLAAQAGAADAPVARATSPLHIDACALLMPAEISKVIGLTVGPGMRNDAGLESNGSYSSACVWQIRPEKPVAADPTAPLNGKSFAILNAMQWPAGSDKARTFLEEFRKASANGDIPGETSPRKVGDEALWWGDGLAVRKGDVSFGLSIFIPGSPAMHSGVYEEKLAPNVLRRLDERARTRS